MGVQKYAFHALIANQCKSVRDVLDEKPHLRAGNKLHSSMLSDNPGMKTIQVLADAAEVDVGTFFAKVAELQPLYDAKPKRKPKPRKPKAKKKTEAKKK